MGNLPKALDAIGNRFMKVMFKTVGKPQNTSPVGPGVVQGPVLPVSIGGHGAEGDIADLCPGAP